MAKLYMDKNTQLYLTDELRRLDEDKREIEAIQKEMDKFLYDIERRIAKLRRSREA